MLKFVKICDSDWGNSEPNHYCVIEYKADPTRKLQAMLKNRDEGIVKITVEDLGIYDLDQTGLDDSILETSVPNIEGLKSFRNFISWGYGYWCYEKNKLGLWDKESLTLELSNVEIDEELHETNVGSMEEATIEVWKT